MADIQALAGSSLPWPAATYRGLGLVQLARIGEKANPSPAMWSAARDGDMDTLSKLLEKSWFNLEERGEVGPSGPSVGGGRGAR